MNRNDEDKHFKQMNYDPKQNPLITNPFKIIWMTKKFILTSFGSVTSYCIIAIFLIFYVIFRFVFKLPIGLSRFSIGILLGPSITALAFTLAILTATMRLFKTEDLAAIYLYGKGQQGKVFYETIAEYIWCSSIWFLLSVFSLGSLLFNFEFGVFIHQCLDVIVSIVSLFGFASLWDLTISYIQVLTKKVQRKLSGEDED